MSSRKQEESRLGAHANSSLAVLTKHMNLLSQLIQSSDSPPFCAQQKVDLLAIDLIVYLYSVDTRGEPALW